MKKAILFTILAAFLIMMGLFVYGLFSVIDEPSPLEWVEFENQDGSEVSMLFYPDAEVVDYDDLGLSVLEEQEEGRDQGPASDRRVLKAPLPYDPDAYLTFSFEELEEGVDFGFESGDFYEIELNQTGEVRDLYIYEEPPMALHNFDIDGSEQVGLMTLDIDSERLDDDEYLEQVGSNALSLPLRTDDIIDIVSTIEVAP